LVDLRRRQNVFHRIVEPSLHDLEFEADALARWFPLGRSRGSIVIDPARAFGRPIVSSGGVPTGPPDVKGGVLKYTQHKMREHSPSKIETPLPADLAAIIRDTPGTGIKLWLLDGNGNSFTEAAFSHWFADRCDEAGLPKKQRPNGEWVRLCTPHGLRKRCLTDMAERGLTPHEIMSISGHLTLKEIDRYTKMADRARNARAAMNKMATGGPVEVSNPAV
jgi:Phage integrase family